MSRYVHYTAEDAVDLLISALESGAESEDLLENLVPECVPEDSESSSENEVEETEMQGNGQSSENAFSRSRTARRTNTNKRCVHDIESSFDEDNYEKFVSDLRPRLYTSYLERPTKNYAGREISWASTISRLERQPRSAVILGQSEVKGRALQAKTHKKFWDLFFSDSMHA